MAPGIATILCAGGIIGLFVLDRDRNARISKALWIPVLWISLSGSRMVSQWLGLSLRIATADQAVEGSPLDRNILAGLIALV